MDITPDIVTILYVDDEAQACKWFARTIGVGHEVLTVNSVKEAKTVLRDSHERISMAPMDFRMPSTNGTELLCLISAEYGDIATILITAYVGKDLPIQAINTGRMSKTLEEPYQSEDARRSLQEALALHRDCLSRTQRPMIIDKMLASLAHELNTPLAAISNFARDIRMRVNQTGPTPGTSLEIGRAAGCVQDNARHCPSVIATFLSSVCNTCGRPGTVVTPNGMGGSTRTLFDTHPFANAQREWTMYWVEDDFPTQTLPNYVMLVFSLLTSNALQVLRQANVPKLEIAAGRGLDSGNMQHMIHIEGNGPGIVSGVLARLTIDPMTMCAEGGGSGMGMIFCTRIIQSFEGAIAIDPTPSAGMHVTLTFL